MLVESNNILTLAHICNCVFNSLWPSDAIWASYQIRKIAVCACTGNAGNIFPHRRFRRKPLVSDPGMYHGTCVTHVPWCMSGSLTCGGGENVPGIPGACATAILRIWQEAHCVGAWPHQAITWTNVDLSSIRSIAVLLRPIFPRDTSAINH